MLNDPAKESDAEPIEIRCYFVRERNALLVRGDFSPIYTDFYLHLMQQQIRYEDGLDDWLKDGLAALTLHLASRPRNEAVAWTLSWQKPLQNLFVTGSNIHGNITGRVFTKDVRKRNENLFVSQVMREGEEARQSMITVDQPNLFSVAETFYEQSEQRRARYFAHGEEDFVLVTAQPECDLEWLESLTDESIRNIDETETLSLLEKREFRFNCGCSIEKIFPIIAGMNKVSLDEMFGGDETIAASCPRCGARYTVTREALEAYIEQ